MDRNTILAKLHKRFPFLPQNAILTTYKARSERVHQLMKNNILVNIRWLIEAKIQLAKESSPKFVAYMPGCRTRNYARKRRTARLPVSCHKFDKIQCYRNPCIYLEVVFDNMKD